MSNTTKALFSRCGYHNTWDSSGNPTVAKRQPRTSKCCQSVDVFCHWSADLQECASSLHSQTESIFLGVLRCQNFLTFPTFSKTCLLTMTDIQLFRFCQTWVRLWRRFGTARHPTRDTKHVEISRNGTFVSPIWVSGAPCRPQGGSGTHFGLPGRAQAVPKWNLFGCIFYEIA